MLRFHFPPSVRPFSFSTRFRKRTTARAGANARFWDCYGDNYFRFPLHRDASGAYSQHELLLDANMAGVQVLYCAPLMHGRGELVGAVRTSAVVDRSALIPVASLGPASFGGPHSVTYPVNELVGEPSCIRIRSRGERSRKQDLERLRAESRRHLDTAAFQQLFRTCA